MAERFAQWRTPNHALVAGWVLGAVHILPGQLAPVYDVEVAHDVDERGDYLNTATLTIGDERYRVAVDWIDPAACAVQS